MAETTHLRTPRADGHVAVIGLGYVGLTLALSLARVGIPVIGVEANPRTRAELRAGRTVLFEPGVAELLETLPADRFTVTDRLPDTPLRAIIICVGTLVDPATRQLDMGPLDAATAHAAEHVSADTLVVVRSTVPVGTTRRVVLAKMLEYTGKPLLAFCPERTIQGQALAELASLPQVIGALDDESLELARALFAPLAADHSLVSSLEAAEMTKLICNSHTDLIYGFGNEIANIAESLDLDAGEIIAAANLRYPRPDLSKPGFVGGSCLTKDPYLLMQSAEAAGARTPMIAAARSVNEQVPRAAVEQVLAALTATGCAHRDAKVLVCGIAYKGHPETDDVRGSAAIEVAELLRHRVAVLAGHDYVVAPERIAELGYRPVTLEEGMTDADAVLLLVDHPSYPKEIDTEAVRSRMRLPAVVFDMWGRLATELAEAEGIEYRRLGCGGANSRHRWSWVRRAASDASPAA
ncbi:nucleotide sugar dehydrogenase [Amycolatopsis sp. H20-H5]|uniref:nucleotide sugar dehydrogenase n=1 Tax=Amycolatopsis sp. H20-H5 TaxID=3046309 RepID=UPI002DBDBA28|nr:nucleotide sugar dehydrogenase [Amycolatopsis sp. H20-H5]MEC3976886.1 nucleotide sugar dehydrogenase [Amycolatopsis sp. H20-H5]